MRIRLPVEAYYQSSGDAAQNFDRVPLSFVVKSISEKTSILDHLGGVYMEWLEYGHAQYYRKSRVL